MAAKLGPKIINDQLVLSLDAADANSYAGEPASNLNSDTNDYTGTSYSYFGEWTSNPTRLSKSYDSTIKTPIGTGATLIQESGTNGYHHLSRMGVSETGNHTISFYFKPVTSDINNLKIGMLGDSNPIITFDFTQSPATVTQTGSAISGKLALLAPLSNGWYFCAADFNGRSGGWVGAVGFNINAAYTGVSGSKKAYICGLNYNNKAYAVPSFDRSATDGWVDRSSNSNEGTLVNGTDTGVSHYRDGQVIMPVANSYLDFDGSDDYVNLPHSELWQNISQISYDLWFKPDVVNVRQGLISSHAQVSGANNDAIEIEIQSNGTSFVGFRSANGTFYSATYGTSLSANTWYNLTGVLSSSDIKYYLNGQLVVTQSNWPGGNVANSASQTLMLARYATYYFNGKIGSFRAYNKALTAAEVLSNYNTVKPRFGL